jgi:hypothetical protein
LLAAIIQAATVRFGLVVDNFVGADIAALCKAFTAHITLVRSFACVTASVSFEIAKLREPTTAARLFAWVWFVPSMRSLVDVEVCLLREALCASLNSAYMASLATFRVARFFLEVTLRELEVASFCWNVGWWRRRRLSVGRSEGATYHRSALFTR